MHLQYHLALGHPRNTLNILGGPGAIRMDMLLTAFLKGSHELECLHQTAWLCREASRKCHKYVVTMHRAGRDTGNIWSCRGLLHFATRCRDRVTGTHLLEAAAALGCCKLQRKRKREYLQARAAVPGCKPSGGQEEPSRALPHLSAAMAHSEVLPGIDVSNAVSHYHFCCSYTCCYTSDSY